MLFTKSLVALATAGGVALTASPALASDAGLYGVQDPTYDGVYRQSLSIMALKSTGQKVPASAVKWLKRQQCGNGGFVEHLPTGTKKCPKPDPANVVGPESNGTALAIAALVHTGNRKQAREAATWLIAKQNSDKGWSYVPGPGATSDTASTALATGALDLLGKTAKGNYLRKVAKRCDAPVAQRGGMSFDTALTDVNDGATAQSALMLGGALELPKPVKIATSTPSLKCSGSARDKASLYASALGFLDKRLVSLDGALPYGGGYPGTDFSGTASAGLALAQAGSGRKAVNKTLGFLRKNAKEWIADDSGAYQPGPLSLLILLTHAAGENPKDFAGINLIRELKQTQQ